MNNNDRSRFVEYDAHPKKFCRIDCVGTAVHSLSVAKSKTWIESYNELITASGQLGLMPDDKKVVGLMLKNNGFFQQPGSAAHRPVKEIIDECNLTYSDGEVLIVNISSSRKQGIYLPLIPVNNGESIKYVPKFPINRLNSNATEVWIAWKDGKDHSVKARRNYKRKTKIYVNQTEDNDSLVVNNENPEDNLIGDCAVRAVAGVLQIPWIEAVRRLAAAQNYTETVINRKQNIVALLKKENFQELGPIVRDGKILTGKQFCALINDMFEEGTRLVAQAGQGHMVAILVFDKDYKIVDTWDSTNRPILKYWAKYPETKERRRPRIIVDDSQNNKIESLESGMTINHSSFGNGRVTDITNGFVTILFDNGSEKKFLSQWVISNCKRA